MNDYVDLGDALQDFWQAAKSHPESFYKLLIFWAFLLGLLLGHYSPIWLGFLWK